MLSLELERGEARRVDEEAAEELRRDERDRHGGEHLQRAAGIDAVLGPRVGDEERRGGACEEGDCENESAARHAAITA